MPDVSVADADDEVGLNVPQGLEDLLPRPLVELVEPEALVGRRNVALEGRVRVEASGAVVVQRRVAEVGRVKGGVGARGEDAGAAERHGRQRSSAALHHTTFFLGFNEQLVKKKVNKNTHLKGKNT